MQARPWSLHACLMSCDGVGRHEALYMITVYQGFFVLAGALSGNVVMDEAAEQSVSNLMAYISGVLAVLSGLVVLTRGEIRAAIDLQERRKAADARLTEQQLRLTQLLMA